MKRDCYKRIAVYLFIFISTLVSCKDLLAASMRQPVWAGKFYPGSVASLSAMIEELTEKAQKTDLKIPTEKPLRAIILPHAGYVYSGYTAAHASHVLKAGMFKKVILIGPDHRVGLRNAAISDVKAYATPLGEINLHSDAQKLRNKYKNFSANDASDSSEHSLEVIVPFLQTYLKEFELVPIVVGNGSISSIAEDLQTIIDPETLLVISSDLSHYLPYDQAVATDRQTIDMIMAADESKILANRNSACGKIPIAITLRLAKKYNWQPVLLHYSNSGDTAGSKDKVVGYTAIAFFEGENSITKSEKISDEHGQTLCKLARQTISINLGKDPSAAELASLKKALANKVFDEKRGVFVTLNMNGNLRGCIGSLAGVSSIRSGVKRNAINAAFNDYRFRPLSEYELDKIDIEVSILTEPKPLKYKDADDLVASLQPDIDGVILGTGRNSATFLPQVWKQLPRPETFLSSLCRKAGLSPDAWRTGKLDVKTYQVQYFDEVK